MNSDFLIGDKVVFENIVGFFTIESMHRYSNKVVIVNSLGQVIRCKFYNLKLLGEREVPKNCICAMCRKDIRVKIAYGGCECYVNPYTNDYLTMATSTSGSTDGNGNYQEYAKYLMDRKDLIL